MKLQIYLNNKEINPSEVVFKGDTLNIYLFDNESQNLLDSKWYTIEDLSKNNLLFDFKFDTILPKLLNNAILTATEWLFDNSNLSCIPDLLKKIDLSEILKTKQELKTLNLDRKFAIDRIYSDICREFILNSKDGEPYARKILDILNFAKIESAEEISNNLFYEKSKTLAKMMLDEQANAKRGKGCTSCALNSIKRKYLNLIEKLEV